MSTSYSASAKTIRNIAAPFQNQHETLGGSSSPTKFGMTEGIKFDFPPLDDYSNITFEGYCGPTPESNWVLPRHLLVGAYPASQDDTETFELLTSILKQGVTKFVCLQQEYRSHGVTEEMWRNGQALRPYYEDVKLVVKMKKTIPELREMNIVDESKVSFVHFPIKDCGITDDGRVLELARTLVKAIHEREVIYLHCWGGHGRTGTLVCIMLHLMYGMDPVEAMRRCQTVHDLRQCPVAVGSPQTQAQRDQVTRIINRLMTQNVYLRRTLSDISLTEPPASPGKSPRSYAISKSTNGSVGDNALRKSMDNESVTSLNSTFPSSTPNLAPVSTTKDSSQSTSATWQTRAPQSSKSIVGNTIQNSTPRVASAAASVTTSASLVAATESQTLSQSSAPVVSLVKAPDNMETDEENEPDEFNPRNGVMNLRASLVGVLKPGGVSSRIAMFEKSKMQSAGGSSSSTTSHSELDSTMDTSGSTPKVRPVSMFRGWGGGSK